jgi:hypothetical protein
VLNNMTLSRLKKKPSSYAIPVQTVQHLNRDIADHVLSQFVKHVQYSRGQTTTPIDHLENLLQVPAQSTARFLCSS